MKKYSVYDIATLCSVHLQTASGDRSRRIWEEEPPECISPLREFLPCVLGGTLKLALFPHAHVQSRRKIRSQKS
ncbi:hypothetical protein RSOLAG1IB_01069 [Rhizoctonia solani AG-1 IB]|uniref:Uncharacterized protein n=1 Tax=Thanatephorus cucumeris (strain AG1-IB / isolate 7/3/14) TaxID=1108050 RepID=A0A0B7FAK7_THACB|nr:hypothetical protein RSOLAG1IB_01069 [Rhizoctonia solani AG-1 IB]